MPEFRITIRKVKQTRAGGVLADVIAQGVVEIKLKRDGSNYPPFETLFKKGIPLAIYITEV